MPNAHERAFNKGYNPLAPYPKVTRPDPTPEPEKPKPRRVKPTGGTWSFDGRFVRSDARVATLASVPDNWCAASNVDLANGRLMAAAPELLAALEALAALAGTGIADDDHQPAPLVRAREVIAKARGL